jgi:hypothetical protein
LRFMLFTPFVALTWIFKTCHSLPHGIKALGGAPGLLYRSTRTSTAMLPPNAASLALTKVYLLKWLAHLSLMEEEYFDVQASNASDGTPNIVLGPWG